MGEFVRTLFTVVQIVLLVYSDAQSSTSASGTGVNVPVVPVYNEFSFRAIPLLDDHEILATPYDVKAFIRSKLECSVQCGSTCQVFSFYRLENICYLYKDIDLQKLQKTYSEPGRTYFQRSDTVFGCSAGMFQAGLDCFLCSRGTYQDLPYQTSCKACPPDHYQDILGATTCNKCENTTDWRYQTNSDRTACTQCYSQFNTYTDGDMANLIKNVTGSSAPDCGRECDATAGCVLFTWRQKEGVCYLHSTRAWSWGVVYQSVIYFRNC